MRRRSPVDRILRVLAALSLAVGIGLPALSFANGVLKPHDGCAVVLVVDGDTVKMICPGEGLVTARLLDFDTPEIFSPACLGELATGLAATLWLNVALLRAAHIAETGRGRDRYGRRLARLSLDRRNISDRIVAAGLARPYDGGRREGWCG